jgi:hypothetical protein
MAEVSFEQWFTNNSCISSSVLSLSPLASIITESSSISRKTFFDKSGIFSKIHWGAEVMIWDQFLSGRPVATSGNRAGSSSFLVAFFKNSGLSVLVDNYWMAEVFSEQWSSGWFSWDSSISIRSFSPLALIIAVSNNISRNTFFDKLNIKGQVHWSAEVMIWDQIFAIRPSAFDSNWTSNIGETSAHSPVSYSNIFSYLCWVAEISSE